MIYFLNSLSSVLKTITEKAFQSKQAKDSPINVLVLYTIFVSYCLTLLVMTQLLNP